ncbi:dTDP-4-dehydrorhamnose reductase [Urechidicola vernalis]|uniref:dTDP-4-dehydrorhamnose reductase n=1 Tax=Urechidicola vernalis TaxID=3075600 RepID=A0ABU2Y8R0_9FLAO|nr:dTDP-4-dehydrorhamnose reductase [Urechidicola sp. P050]MDT0554132.1 dTDP-4-dehydrorhamnose reductase [Urechidicola sp. P050]
MKNVLVTGGNGQLGQCLKDLILNEDGIKFIFTDYKELDITNNVEVSRYFQKNKIDYCINCAAYTAVDLAESESETAIAVNVKGVQNLASACKNSGAILIHVSTDFVFDGTKNTPYREDNLTSPTSVYGSTKLEGEQVIQKTLKEHFIIRTSWLYSEYGNNFMKTMIRLGNERSELGVVNDQIGTPTYAKDLAQVILQIVKSDSDLYGIYHYSNDGVISWFDFAKSIFELENISVQLNGIPTKLYPTPAKRPKYSVLDKTKIKEMLKMNIPYWKDSLKQALQAYHNL